MTLHNAPTQRLPTPGDGDSAASGMYAHYTAWTPQTLWATGLISQTAACNLYFDEALPVHLRSQKSELAPPKHRFGLGSPLLEEEG